VNNIAATLEELVDHYIEFFKRVEANFVPVPLSRQSRRQTACTSTDSRRLRNAKRSSRTSRSFKER
jgi:hypothetical protein